jgi:hypothetical protein
MDRELEHRKKELDWIAEVPVKRMSGEPRAALVELSRLGLGVTAYRPLGHDADDFKIYIRALEQVRPWKDPRLPLDEYLENWRVVYRSCTGLSWPDTWGSEAAEERVSA